MDLFAALVALTGKWTLIAGVIVIIIILLSIIFGYMKAIYESGAAKYNPRDYENSMNGRPSPYDTLDQNRRRNVSASEREASSFQRESSVKSIPLPSYEDLQPPSYDVAVHL